MKHSHSDRHGGYGRLGMGLLVGGGMALAAMYGKARSQQHDGDSAPGWAARRGFGDYEVHGRSVTIGRPRAELFAFWRDFGNLPRFMENIEQVRPTGDKGRAVWTIKAPAGHSVDVETEIVREEEGRLIAWASVEGSEVETHGRVEFEDAPGDRGTRVRAIIAYQPPAGLAGELIAKLFLREPAIQARHDLKRFQMLMETGEIATSARRPQETRQARQSDEEQQKEEV